MGAGVVVVDHEPRVVIDVAVIAPRIVCSVRGDIQLSCRRVPEHVGARLPYRAGGVTRNADTVVYQNARVNPVLGSRVQAMDIEGIIFDAVENAPPVTVVPP